MYDCIIDIRRIGRLTIRALYIQRCLFFTAPSNVTTVVGKVKEEEN
jgi:hypothetical protein